jgi:hypothetical protein
MPDLIAKVIQEVKQNVNGTIIGVQTGIVQGDVIDVKIYTFPVGADRSTLLATMIGKRPRPYKFLEPYTPEDRELFAGRTAEVKQVIEAILQPQRLLVIYGEAGVGKTSLVSAGIIPKLMEWGALTIQIQDYLRPFEAIRKALRASAERIKIDRLDDLKTIPELIGRIIESTGGTLVLIFDQFELLFEPTVSEEQQQQFIDDLVALRDKQNTFYEFLFIIILVRDEANGKTAGLRDRIPEIWKCPIPLLPLSCDLDQTAPRDTNAFKAIYEPLEKTDFPVSPVGDIIENYIVPDLDALTPGKPNSVHPPYLQIVCQWLYDMGRKREPHNIDVALYRKGNWADGILARYMTDTLETNLKDVYQQAEQLLVQMASPGVEHWVSPARLQLKDVGKQEMRLIVTQVLERLVEAELLVRRKDDNEHYLYALAHPVIKEKARLIGGKEAERRFQAADELERAWSVWLARKVMGSTDQLRYLSESGTHLSPPAIQSLFLLRSATERGEPTQLWLKWLRDSAEGPSLISQLETLEVLTGHQPAGPSVLDKARSLLGLKSQDDQAAQSNNADKAEKTFGPVTENAVRHKDAAVRQASALALIVMEENPRKALHRIEDGLEDNLGWLRGKRRMAELYGALADAEPEIETLNAKLWPHDRFLIWEWRAMQRVRRNWSRILWLTAGGAIGASLGMALFRLIAAVNVGLPAPSAVSAIWLYVGATLGAALSLGVALAGSLVSARKEENNAQPGTLQRYRGLKTTMAATVLGAVLFGLVHIIIGIYVIGRFPERLFVILGFVVGLGLGYGLRLQAGDRRASLPRRVIHLLVAALIVAFTQFFIINYSKWRGADSSAQDNTRAKSTAITWPPAFYRNKCHDDRDCTNQSSILDAALAALVLTGSTALGISRARKFLPGRRP